MRLLPLSNPPAQRVVWGEEAMLERLARHRARRLGGEPALDLLPLVGMAVRRHHRVAHHLGRDGADEVGRRRLLLPRRHLRYGATKRISLRLGSVLFIYLLPNFPRLVNFLSFHPLPPYLSGLSDYIVT